MRLSRTFIIALFAMGIGYSAVAQTNAPIASSPPTEAASPASVSSTTPDSTRYVNDPKLLSDCEAQLALFNDKPCDIIFIGDSNTSGWLGTGKEIWNKSYAPRHSLDFGVPGDTTQNVLWRLNNMQIQDLKPKVAVVQIGANNTDNNAHEVADGIKAVLANTQAAFPDVKIILVSVISSDQDNDKTKKIDSLIKNYADDSTVYYLDLVPLLRLVSATTSDDQASSPTKGLGPDHLLDASGYQIWADAMEPLLAKLLAGGN